MGSATATVAGFQKQLPFQNFVGDKTVGKSGIQYFVGFQRGWCEAEVSSLQRPHLNPHFLQTKWTPSGRRQLRRR